MELCDYLWKDAEISLICNPHNSLGSPVLLWAAVIGSVWSCTWRVRKDLLRHKDLDLPCSTIPVLPRGCHVFFWKMYQRTSLCHSSAWGRQQLYPRSHHWAARSAPPTWSMAVAHVWWSKNTKRSHQGLIFCVSSNKANNEVVERDCASRTEATFYIKYTAE